MSQQPNWYILAKRYPAVTLLVVLSAVGGMLVSFSSHAAIGYFSFGGMNDSQYWRLITPIFLHFGILHFIFNSLWLSMLGSRIEEVMGTLHLMLIVVTTGKQACPSCLGVNNLKTELSNSTVGSISFAPYVGVNRRCEKGEGA